MGEENLHLLQSEHTFEVQQLVHDQCFHMQYIMVKGSQDRFLMFSTAYFLSFLSLVVKFF